MAVALVAGTVAADGSLTAGTTSFAYDSGATGTDRCLVVAFTWEQGGDQRDITAATYNGVALTKAVEEKGSSVSSFVEYTSMWYLPAPATGSNTLAITISATGQDLGFIAATYEGVNQTTSVGQTASTTKNSSDATITSAITTLNDNSVIITGACKNGADQAAPDASEGLNTELLQNNLASGSSGFSSALLSQPTTTAGAYTAGSTFLTTGRDMSLVALELNPVAIGPTISDIDTDDDVYPSQTPVTLTGSGLGADGGTLKFGVVSQTVSVNTATTATFTVVQGGLKYAIHNAIWTDTLAVDSSAFPVTLSPDADHNFIDVFNPISDNTSLFYLASPEVVTGDQLETPKLTDQGEVLTAAADGTFVITAAAGLQTFTIRVWDATDSSWSTGTVATLNGLVVGGGMVRSMVSPMVTSMIKIMG